MQLLFTSPLFLRAELTFKIPLENVDDLGNAKEYEEVTYTFSVARVSKSVSDKQTWGNSVSGALYSAYTKTPIDPRIGVKAIGVGSFSNGRLIKAEIKGFSDPAVTFVQKVIGQTLIMDIIDRAFAQ